MPVTDRYMTMDEIEREFDGEWVLIAEPDMTPGTTLSGGRVVFHSEDPDEVSQAARDMPLRSEAMFYVGDIPEFIVAPL